MAEQSIAQSLINAGSGLAGVVIGAAITWFREERKEERVRQGDSKYLAVLVMGHLENLVRQCVTIASDVGLDDEGRPAGEHSDGYPFLKPTTLAPKFEPLTLDVNWKALDTDLMAQILDLPGELAHIKRSVAAKIVDDIDPYDGEYFPYRRVLYAGLARRVAGIYRDLQATLGTNPVYLSRYAELGAQADEALQTANEALLGYARQAEQWRQKQAALEAKEEEEEARKRAAEQAPTA
ncbi:hypothetical protein [Variovorax soli]|uniref:Secreted protein n=1 Tax=Variovorax soli TaxID=376815 RepID=A0ABU1NMA9_9BURK|nr:hypothetical protein [Variovorax soli]MDR6539488.1 hypothetical protein [Variovorax soli]